MTKSWKIPKTNKVISITLLETLLGDWGFIILDLEIDLLLKGDHSPSFRICWILMEMEMFEFRIYDIRQKEYNIT
jgi:hypothetical protein